MALLESVVPQFALRINGAPVPPRVMADILEIVVENSLHLPDVCTIRVHDNDFQWLDRETFREGAAVVVEAGWERNSMEPLFDGEVTGMELDLAGGGVSTLVVRCYDRSHRLHMGRRARAFNQVKDSDIVQRIGQEMGFDVQATATSQVHDWVLQYNQTNWEFLVDRAQRNGFRLYLQGEKQLVFEPVVDRAPAEVSLKWGGVELRSFRPRVSAATQVAEVEVRGWDPKTKRKIVGVAKKPSGTPVVGDGRWGGEVARESFGINPRMVVVDRPVHSEREATSMAQSILDEIAGGYLTADGLCDGNPKLKPTVAVDIQNIGERFKGKYYVTSTTHAYTPKEGYTTQFQVSGKSPSTLLSLLSDADHTRGSQKGAAAVAVVTDNKDPEGMGRVKVKYPWLSDDISSFWARTTSQMAGGGRGMFNLPEIDDEVLVTFEQGEVSRPYVVGMLWNGVDGLPSTDGNPVHGPSSEVNRRGFYSRVGHKIDIDDTGGGGIKLTTQAGIKVHCTDDGPTILCSTPGGQSMKLTDTGSLVEIKDNAGDIMTMSNGVININASTVMNLTAPMINITGAVAVTVNGLTIAVNAGAMTSIMSGVLTAVESGNVVHIGAKGGLRAEAEGKAELQGKGGVEIDGTSVVEVSAAEIKLN